MEREVFTITHYDHDTIETTNSPVIAINYFSLPRRPPPLPPPRFDPLLDEPRLLPFLKFDLVPSPVPFGQAALIKTQEVCNVELLTVAPMTVLTALENGNALDIWHTCLTPISH